MKKVQALFIIGISLFIGLLCSFLIVTHTKIPKAPTATKKTVRIGILAFSSNMSHQALLKSLKNALTNSFYTIQYYEQSIVDTDQFDSAASLYAHDNVDAIITVGTPAVKAALKATTTIPIIFAGVGDPVGNGVAQSLDASGNNATGISSLSVDLTVKRLDILKEFNPQLKRAYFIYQPGEIASENSRTKAEAEAELLGITLVELPVRTSKELPIVARNLTGTNAQAITMAASAMIWTGETAFEQAQQREHLPFIGIDKSMAENGAIVTYGPNYVNMGKQAAKIVIEVLNGVTPNTLPIQRPETLELVINERVASQLGITIPPAFLAKATERL